MISACNATCSISCPCQRMTNSIGAMPWQCMVCIVRMWRHCVCGVLPRTRSCSFGRLFACSRRNPPGRRRRTLQRPWQHYSRCTALYAIPNTTKPPEGHALHHHNHRVHFLDCFWIFQCVWVRGNGQWTATVGNCKSIGQFWLETFVERPPKVLGPGVDDDDDDV